MPWRIGRDHEWTNANRKIAMPDDARLRYRPLILTASPHPSVRIELSPVGIEWTGAIVLQERELVGDRGNWPN